MTKKKKRRGPEINGRTNPGHYRRIKSGSAGRLVEVKHIFSLSFSVPSISTSQKKLDWRCFIGPAAVDRENF